jgi:hypothetical protein
VRNRGARRVRVFATPSSFSFDLYGNARIAAGSQPRRSARAWLTVRPGRLVLAPGKRGVFRITAQPPRGASPGDHHALVLLSARALRNERVAIGTRLGVLVFVRVPGRVVRRVTIGRAWVSRTRASGSIAVTAINRGNLAERLLSGQVTVAMWRARRLVTSLRGPTLDLLPRSRGLVLIPVRQRLRGLFTAVVRIAAQPGRTSEPSAPPLAGVRRAFTLRL